MMQRRTMIAGVVLVLTVVPAGPAVAGCIELPEIPPANVDIQPIHSSVHRVLGGSTSTSTLAEAKRLTAAAELVPELRQHVRYPSVDEVAAVLGSMSDPIWGAGGSL